MKGWFDAFRTDGGPTLYTHSNRTSVTGDYETISIYALFAIIYISFIIIFPGVRKQRFPTFITVTLSLFVGCVILVSKCGSHWHVANSEIVSYYRAFSGEKLSADIGVFIGLMHFNVTLKGAPRVNNSLVHDYIVREDIDYNERFHWDKTTEIHDEFREALVKGLPYPILTVAEYFNMDEEGFCWGRQYRLAGYYCHNLLWACFASWCLMNLLLLFVPRYGGYMMAVTGSLMLGTNLLYYVLIPPKPLMIRFEDHILMFNFGYSFWILLISGVFCVAGGGIIAIFDLFFPHVFSTILEVDYDTPYDRHIIIEESHETRKKKGNKRSLEEPQSLGLGRKILRTLSKREKHDEYGHRLPSHMRGVENEGFEVDPPKSPWRYPSHMMYHNDDARGALATAMAKNPALARLAAPTPTKSPKSVSFRRQSRLEQIHTVEPKLKRSDSKDSTTSSSSSGIGINNEHDELPNFQSQFKPVQRTDSQQSGSSVSSFGLSRLLSRTQSQPLREPSPPHLLTHLPLSNQKSKEGHLPLSRIHYKQDHIGLIQLPRASLERKSSDEMPGSRRASDNSSSSSLSRTESSGFSSNSFDFSKQKRVSPDGIENDERR